VKIGSVRKLELIFNLSLYTVIFISLFDSQFDEETERANILGFLTGGAKYPRILGRGSQISLDFGQGVPNILGFLTGGAKYPTV